MSSLCTVHIANVINGFHNIRLSYPLYCKQGVRSSRLTVVQIPNTQVEASQKLIEVKAQDLRDQFGLKEAQLSISLESSSAASTTVLTEANALRLIALLLVLPHGVAKMSHAVTGEYLGYRL